MVEFGDTSYAREIGKNGRNKYIWYSCPNCQRGHWVETGRLDKAGFTGWCKSCVKRGVRSGRWNGGRKITVDGYILIYLKADNFFYPMADKLGYVLEHRLVMAQSLGRNLHSWEIVHHKNGIKDNNQLNNLELTTRGNHTIQHNNGYQDGYGQGYQDGQTQKIKELKQEIEFLRQKIIEFSTQDTLIWGVHKK